MYMYEQCFRDVCHLHLVKVAGAWEKNWKASTKRVGEWLDLHEIWYA